MSLREALRISLGSLASDRGCALCTLASMPRTSRSRETGSMARNEVPVPMKAKIRKLAARALLSGRARAKPKTTPE